MLTFLFILFIIFFVIPLFRVIFAIGKVQKNARRAYKQAQSGQHRERRAGWSSSTSGREKIFDRNIGEYIDFEEVECNKINDRPQQQTAKQQSTKIEQQIVDAEWEDIK